MPAAKRKSTASKAKPKVRAKASSSPPAMSDSQKTIYNKLRKRGMSEKQAIAFSKHAARRKDAAAAKGSKPTASKSKSRKVTSSRSKKK